MKYMHIRSYVVLLYHCEGWDPANMFNPATLFMYVPVPSQEPVYSVVVVCLCVTYLFFDHFFYINKAVSFSFELFYIVLSGPFIADYTVWALLIVEGRYGDL